MKIKNNNFNLQIEVYTGFYRILINGVDEAKVVNNHAELMSVIETCVKEQVELINTDIPF